MSNKNLTEIIFVVDRSGSMEAIRKDMIGGFNAFIKDQQKLDLDCKVSMYQFDCHWHSSNDIVEKIYETMDLSEVPLLTEETFVPRGGTPLRDAVAFVVKRTDERFAKLSADEKPEKVMVVCITDGQENSSQEWSAEQIKQMIESKEKDDKWEFVYLGANQDAWEEGGYIGIKSSSTLGYVASAGGTDKMFKSLSSKVCTYRSCADVSDGIAFDEEDRSAQEEEGYKH